MTSERSRLWRAPIALLALLLLLAACGSDSEQPALSGDPTTSTTEAPVESTTTTEAEPVAECSSSTLPEDDTAGSADLEPAVAELRTEIMEAALACDYATLEELAMDGESQFNYSFGAPGGGAFADHLRQREEAGEPVVKLLVQMLRLPSTVLEQPEGDIVTWPSANSPEATEEDWAALEDVYTPEEIAGWRQAGSYLGYRVGITGEGDWLYFVAGD